MSDGDLKFTPWIEPVFWRCGKGTSLAELTRSLGIPAETAIELSAGGWADEARAFADLERAFAFETPWGLNWDAAGDRLSDFRATHPRYLVVIRDLPESQDGRANVAQAALAIGAEYPSERTQCVVLEAWPSARLQAPSDRGRPGIPVRDL
jgi:hypothetical protein